MQKQLKDRPKLRQSILGTVIILFLIPATILFGILFLNDRKYYFISLLIIIYAMIPFVLLFEKRKPKVRELVIIVVLSAIAAAGRGAFFMLPQFKPVIAIVVIAGVCFGGEAGFLVGAVTGFVSNFFFGQGPWTPWQMFAMGIIGSLAGVFFKLDISKKNKLPLCVFGGFSTFFIYGGIMNIASLLMSVHEFTWAGLLAIFISGIWFDLIHAFSTIFFLYFMSQPMIEKLDRIKIKYGF